MKILNGTCTYTYTHTYIDQIYRFNFINLQLNALITNQKYIIGRIRKINK